MNSYVQREKIRRGRQQQPRGSSMAFTVCTVGLGALVAVAAVAAGMSP